MLLISHPPCPLPQEGGEVRAAALVKQGGLRSTTQSRYARMHKDSHTKLLHDATAQMAVIAQMQRHKWLSLHRCNGTNGCHCTDAVVQMADDLYGGFAPPPRLVSTVCLTYKINYSIIRGKMQVKFSGENHGFLWQNVKLRYAFTTQRKNAKISITILRIRKELRL